MSNKAKVVTFSAGPGRLPEEVLKQVQAELLDYQGAGVSVLELSHRSKTFETIINQAKQDLIDVLHIPNTHEVLFLAGGGVGQFSAVPLNLLGNATKADYAVSGSWSASAVKTAKQFVPEVNMLFPVPGKFTDVPRFDSWKVSPDAAYLYYCDNETVNGVEFDFVPSSSSNIPIICDMSSNILTRPIDVSKYGLIFAGAQKNLGGAGLTIVIVRKDLLGKASKHCPSILNYTTMSEQNSLMNTPPCFNIYVTGLCIKWVKNNGGIEGVQKLSAIKSGLIYDTIDKSNGFYHCPVEKRVRSRVNIAFRIGGQNGNDDLEKEFIEEAKKRGLIELKGHRSVGGMRASLYNGVTVEETKRLADLMADFQRKHTK